MSIISDLKLNFFDTCSAKILLELSDSFSGIINPKICSDSNDFVHSAAVTAESIPPLKPKTTPFF